MSWAHEVLGIGPGAETLEVKRAYARLLKKTRPEDDAEGFQRLHEAFEECLAHCRRVAAGEPDPWEWDEDEDEAFAPEVEQEAEPEEHEEEPANEPVEVVVSWEDFQARMREQARAAIDAPVAAMVEEILAAARRDDGELEKWLRTHDTLYGIAFKHEVGEAILPRLVEEKERMPWRSIATILAFFEYDSVADPRLRENWAARQLWEHARASERFQKHIQSARKLHYGATAVDRLVDRELFQEPHAGRRVAMQWLPLFAQNLGNKLKSLEKIDRARAHQALSPSAREFWPPLFNPARLHWRRYLPAMAQLLVATGLLIGLLKLLGAGASSAELMSYWAVFFGVCAAVYWAFTLWRLGTHSYVEWRVEKFGRGDAPAGSTLFADPSSTLMLLIGTLCVAFVAATARAGAGAGGTGVAVYLIVTVLVGRHKRLQRKRWEEMLFLPAAAFAFWPVLALTQGSTQAEELWMHRVLLSIGLALLSLVAIDVLEARIRKLSLPHVRDRLSWPLLAATALAIASAVAWFPR